MSEAIAEFCVLKEIKLWLLKPFSTHVKQPLDLSTFGPFKIYVFQFIRVWQSRNFGDSLSKYLVILEAAYPALEKVFSNPDLVKSGFRQAGLFPWNPAAIDTRKLEPSKVFDERTIPTTEIPTQERLPTGSPERLPTGSQESLPTGSQERLPTVPQERPETCVEEIEDEKMFFFHGVLTRRKLLGMMLESWAQC